MTLKDIYHFLHPKFQNLFLEYKVDFKPRYGYGKPPHQKLYDLINSNRSIYSDILRKAVEFQDIFHGIKQAGDNHNINDPVWNNGFLPGLDIIGLYTIISIYQSKTYIEVGSGNSTKVCFKAKKDQKLNTKIISFDPFPRVEIDHLADSVYRQPFENTDFDIILKLKEDDILFIDNSHRILPNSDSMVFFLEVLPNLNRGVIVHLHDIYLPYDYPQFMCDRAYSEQYGLAMYLLANPEKYKPLLPNYFIYNDKELSSIIEPVWTHKNLDGVEKHGGSFWFRIK